MKRILNLLTLALVLSPTLAQNPQRATTPPRPVPRWPDGRVNLGAPLGETGLWVPPGIVQVSVNPKSVNRAGANTHLPDNKIGRASCRERVEIREVAGRIKRRR